MQTSSKEQSPWHHAGHMGWSHVGRRLTTRAIKQPQAARSSHCMKCKPWGTWGCFESGRAS